MVGADGVPVFVRQCIELIEERGLLMEGIYRVSGKKEACLMLQDKFDQGQELCVLNSVHAAPSFAAGNCQ